MTPTLCLWWLLLYMSVGCVTSSTIPTIHGISLNSTSGTNGTIIPGTGITPISWSDDAQSYFVLLKTGEINFRVALDTASSDLWILSSSCGSEACRDLPRYPLSYSSPTFITLNGNTTTLNVSYADDTGVSGFVAAEEVTVANVTVSNQTFGLVTESDVNFKDDISGILGLGFSRLSSIGHSMKNATPFFVELAQSGVLDYPLFGISLNEYDNGTLTLGAVDASIVSNLSQIIWNEVVEFSPVGNESRASSYLHWAIPLQGIIVNDTSLDPIPTYANITGGGSIALIDIGTYGIYGPYQDVSRVFSLIPSSRLVDTSGRWAIPCDSNVTLTFVFGNYNFSLQPHEYLIGQVSGNPSFCLTWPAALPPSADGIDWQFGGIFLRTVYSVFSFGINAKEAPHIGFYPLSTNGSVFALSASTATQTTIQTTLPNFALPTPSLTVPSYLFNASVSAPTGGTVFSGLATSTYIPIFAKGGNISQLPFVTPSPTLATFIVTDQSGSLSISTSTAEESQVTLGVPPGWNADSQLHPGLLRSSITWVMIIYLIFIIV